MGELRRDRGASSVASMAVGWVLIPRANPLDDGPDHMVIAAFTNRFVAKFEFLSTYYGNEFGREHYLCKGQSIRTDVPQLFMTSCGPSTTQLEAAEHQARWAPAMQRGRRCKRRGRSRRPHHRLRCAACHWSTWSAASAASGLVLTASRCTWVAPESGSWAEPFQRV